MQRKQTGNAMFSKARLDTPGDGIVGVAMTLLILDMRLPDDFHPKDGGELLRDLLGLWPKFSCLMSRVSACHELCRAFAQAMEPAGGGIGLNRRGGFVD
jgi:hypothetical protein